MCVVRGMEGNCGRGGWIQDLPEYPTRVREGVQPGCLPGMQRPLFLLTQEGQEGGRRWNQEGGLMYWNRAPQTHPCPWPSLAGGGGPHGKYTSIKFQCTRQSLRKVLVCYAVQVLTAAL